jgi:hypothetical protein
MRHAVAGVEPLGSSSIGCSAGGGPHDSQPFGFRARRTFVKRSVSGLFWSTGCAAFCQTHRRKTKRGRHIGRPRSGERGIRTPGTGFPAHGISSAAAVGSTTLGRCNKMPCFVGFSACPELSESCQNPFCQNPVKIRSTSWAALCGIFVKRRRSFVIPPELWQLGCGCHEFGIVLGEIEPTVHDLANRVKPRVVAPWHCTGWREETWPAGFGTVLPTLASTDHRVRSLRPSR